MCLQITVTRSTNAIIAMNVYEGGVIAHVRACKLTDYIRIVRDS